MDLDWKSTERRLKNVNQLKKLLDEYEKLGYLAEDIEESCYRSASTESEYLEKLQKILLDRSDLDNNHLSCDICNFLRKATSKEWKLLNQLDI